ncbi:MAG: hypothetical protein ACI4E1_06125 [Lachnospira sp.]
MPTGVYKTTKKDNSIYYRVSITYKGRHISLGSSDNEMKAAKIYRLASDIISNRKKHYINPDNMSTSYKSSYDISFSKYVSLINFRDNGIYVKTPIYLSRKQFLYFIDCSTALIFSTDDLFYYSNHTIMKRGGYYFVNDYGSQTSILSRYGIRKHSVKGRDYYFRNGDEHDYRYENVVVVNPFNGVTQIEKSGRIMFRSKIHINGEYILGEYTSVYEAAIAYNKAADLLAPFINVQYERNYIDELSPIEYAKIFNSVKLSRHFMEYVRSNS